MRKQVIRSVLAMTMLFGVVATAGAQTLPGSGWFTSATLQNVGTADATVNLDVYPLNGVAGTAASTSFTLTPGSSKVFLPGQNNANGTVDVSPSLSNNFSGSMVVSSNQPVVAIGQIGNNVIAGTTGLGISGGYAAEQYRGSDAVASTLIFPTVKANFATKTNIFYVQAGGTDVNYTATIKTGDAASHTKTGAITANRSVLLTPADFTPALATTNCGSDPNTSPCFGALTVTATGGNIVGAEVEYKNDVSPATLAQSTSLFPISDASDTVFCTTAKNAFGPATRERTTGISVGNAGATAVAVNVLFTTSLPTAGQTYNATATIQPGASAVFSAQTSTVGGMPAGNLASAKITGPAGSQLVAVVNESNFPASAAIPQKATTYSCSSAAAATSKVALPLFKEDFAGRTGLTIQNVDSTAATVTATFTCGAPGTVGNYTLTSPAIQPNAGYTFFDVSTLAGGPVNGSFCGASLDAGGKKIIAVAQTSTDFQSPAGLLNTQNYEGFNQ
jgi:hypothetical protein